MRAGSPAAAGRQGVGGGARVAGAQVDGPVAIRADGVGRYAREAEAAVYFSCLEALQNVAKYASASRATVSLSDGDGRLRFRVADDGVGFDASSSTYGTGLQGIADRLAALDGELEVRSPPGAGTTLAGSLPVAG